jgi:hypothetical protein
MTKSTLLIVMMASACSGGASGVEISRSSPGRCELSTLPFTVGHLAVEGDDLVTDVVTTGMCAPLAFSVCWDGAVSDTLPGQVDLVVTFKPDHGTCAAMRTDRLRIDLGVLRDQRPLDINVLDEEGYNENTPGVRFE